MRHSTIVLSVFALLTAAGCGADLGRGDGGAGNGSDGGGGGSIDLSGSSQGCVGLQCQIAQCPVGMDTIVTGKVVAPNGKDPVPGALVYVPSMGLPEFPSTVSCDLCGDVAGAAAQTQTTFDGKFTLTHVPSGQQIPVVVQLGRFRRVVHFDVQPCLLQGLTVDVGSMGTRLPRKDAESDPGDSVPHVAVATGDYDQIECVLKRMGLEQFDLYLDRDPGAPPATKGTFSSLLANPAKLATYNILVVNCTNNQFEAALAGSGRKNLHDFVAAGGRLYATDWAYDVIEQVPEFAPYVCFEPRDGSALMCGGGKTMPPMSADTHSDYSTQASIQDPGLRQWLGQFPGVLQNNKVAVDFSFVVVDQVSSDKMNFPTTTWVTGDTSGFGVRPLTVTFDYNACGRVHYSTYNTEPNGNVPDNERYPNCKPDFSPQERILEYLVFEIASCVAIPG